MIVESTYKLNILIINYYFDYLMESDEGFKEVLAISDSYFSF